MIDATNLAARDVRTKLKEMDKENKKLEKGTAEFRIRASMHGTLTKKFLDVMAEYQEIQTKYKNKFRERVERQYKIGKLIIKKKKSKYSIISFLKSKTKCHSGRN